MKIGKCCKDPVLWEQRRVYAHIVDCAYDARFYAERISQVYDPLCFRLGITPAAVVAGVERRNVTKG